MADIKWRFWQDIAKRLVDRNDGTWMERVEAYPPKVLMTDNDGQYARLRVDVGETQFWAGKQFRTFQKLTISSGATVAIRAIVGVNIVLYETSFHTEDSSIEVQLKAGGTASGEFTSMPVIRKNTMTNAPVITSQVSMAYDGAHTGGTLIDLIRVTSNNKGSNFSAGDSERGVAPGTYYYVITNTGNQTATVVFSGYWEERI